MEKRKVCDKFRLHEEIASELRVGKLLHVRDEWTKVKGHAGSEGSEQRLREEKAQGLDGMF